MGTTSATAASRSSYSRESEDDPLRTAAATRPAPREVDVDSIGHDGLHAASLAAFAGASASASAGATPQAAGTFTVGSMLPAWRQDVPVTSNAPVDVDKVERNMLARPDAEAVLFVGMNTESATRELNELAKHANVVTVSSNLNSDQKVTLGGRTYDLKPPFAAGTGPRADDPSTGRPTESQFRAFLLAQGMPEAQAGRIAARMDALPPGEARVELAELASIFWKGQTGSTIPSRLLISGHSGTGTHAWGSGSANLTYDEIRFLAKEMPRAAAQIEDVHIGTCSSLNNVTLDLGEWQKAFPNLKTTWAYEHAAGHAPVSDQVDWERQTRGHGGKLEMTAGMQQHHVAFWSAQDNKVEGIGSYGEMANKFEVANRRFGATLAGRTSNPGALEDDFRAYVAISQRPDFSQWQRATGGERASQLLRLRYYPDVATKFAATHSSKIARGYLAVGLRAPDFGRLDRAAAHLEIGRFLAKAGAAEDNPPAGKLAALLEQFDNLDRKAVPEAWCQHRSGGAR